ncbi:hypothetical protein AB0P04_40925, partial [Streptomyces anulatus]
MWFLDRTVRRLRLNPALLTRRPTDPARLESLLRRYDPGLTASGDRFTARGVGLCVAEITEDQAVLARLPGGRRGAIIACGGGRAAGRYLLAGLACRLGGTLHPPGEHDDACDYVDLEVRLDGGLRVGCERVAELVRPILGERTVDHDHDLRVCRIEGRKGDPILVTYEYPRGVAYEYLRGVAYDYLRGNPPGVLPGGPPNSPGRNPLNRSGGNPPDHPGGGPLAHPPRGRAGHPPPGGPPRDSGHVVGLEIEVRDPHRSDMEILYRAALAVSSATGGG